jgi:Ulp1 family protease
MIIVSPAKRPSIFLTYFTRNLDVHLWMDQYILLLISTFPVSFSGVSEENKAENIYIFGVFREYILTNIKDFLEEDLEKKFKDKKKNLQTSCPIVQQNNNYDSGVFTCKFPDYLPRKADINFTQTDMTNFREGIT